MNVQETREMFFKYRSQGELIATSLYKSQDGRTAVSYYLLDGKVMSDGYNYSILREPMLEYLFRMTFKEMTLDYHSSKLVA